MRRMFAIIGLTATMAAGMLFAGSIASAGQDKVTICHAAGQAGTTHFVTLTIGAPAVYGPGGHFNENGTPQAGHEQDYMGPCQGDETTTTDTTETTTTDTDTTPDNPRCPPGQFPTAGKDGQSGNQECEYPPVAPPVVGPTPPVCVPKIKIVEMIVNRVKIKRVVVYKTRVVVKWKTKVVHKTKIVKVPVGPDGRPIVRGSG